MKIKYVTDLTQQYKEKNVDWKDYPTIGMDAARGIRKGKRLGAYYKSWEEYYKKCVEDGTEERINNIKYM